ncbi:hypothetical protein R3P38DRAFT_2776926 [Favolaschia claudopus]|uniref:Uncharacterized protein n=1 Tax=Favolaschia claudopus TaxID=2862362 RepID=A0AAW0BPE6_9AGAR
MASVVAYPTHMAYLVVPVAPVLVALPLAVGTAVPSIPPSVPPTITSAPAVRPPVAPASTASPKEPVKKEKATSTLPAPLVEMLRTEGPYLANEVFSTVPSQPLEPVEETFPVPEWYSITRGRFVGVTDQYALAEFAISGVAGYARKAYATQEHALRAFNLALTWGGVQIV